MSKMKSICLFNHKGGVSKTTTAFNLGWSLADFGKKVLIVDLDSQCNLTGLVLGHNAIDDDMMESFYANAHNLTMEQIGYYVSGKTSDAPQGHLCQTLNKNLFVLPGHLVVSELDTQISVALKIAPGVYATRDIPHRLPKFIKAIAEQNSIDYVIYDLSPNVGGLNQVILMASDYFIIPTAPDYFSLQAIKSLSNTIPDWHKEITNFKESNAFKDDFAIKNYPQFLGVIHQRYRIRNARPGQSFERWMLSIQKSVEEYLVPELKKINCIKNQETYDLAYIPDFNSLIAISQQLSKPVFSLTKDDLKNTANVFGIAAKTMFSKIEEFKTSFTELSKRVIVLTE